MCLHSGVGGRGLIRLWFVGLFFFFVVIVVAIAWRAFVESVSFSAGIAIILVNIEVTVTSTWELEG